MFKVSAERDKTRFAIAFAAIIALGISLSAVTLWRGASVNDSVMSLVADELPAFDGLARLKTAVLAEMPILYEYYATEDQTRFRARYDANRESVQAGFALLERTFPGHDQLRRIRQAYGEIESVARALDATLCCRPVDWDHARKLLLELERLTAQIGPALDLLVAERRDTVYRRGAVARQEVGQIVRMVVGFSAALFLLMLVSGYSLRAYSKETRARRQLALFPERNPAPILSVAADGRVLYANAGARRMLESHAGANAELSILLPPDIRGRLAGALLSRADVRFEYEVVGRALECEVHPLPDADVFHVYLTDITERKRAEQRLVHQAFHDALTGLPNRFRFEARATEAIHGASPQRGGAVLMIAVDRLRLVIDSFGHQSGDEVLKAAASRLLGVISAEINEPGAALFRMEGAKFALLLPHLQDEVTLDRLTRAMLALAHQPLRVGERDFFVSYSVGAALFPGDGDDLISVVKRADSAVQAQKVSGGNGFRRYSRDLDARVEEMLELENGLRRALRNDELVVHYQPQVRIVGGGLIGFEALVRWQHPHEGMVPPGRFIPVAEESGLIVQVGEWVLRAACRQAQQWVERGVGDFAVSVNISPRQFSAGNLPDVVRAALDDSGLDGRHLELEITESAAMNNVERTIETLRALKGLGVRLAIDDFGTGYSSLAYLRRFPLDKLKVDQSFVRGMAEDGRDAAIVKTVITLGRSLDLRVIAEGVETVEQREQLRAYGCDEIQGYLIGRPVAADEIARRWLPRPALSVVAQTSGA